MVDGKMNKLNILYEDNHIIVVVKDFNILSQEDNTKDLDLFNMIKLYIKEKYKKQGNVYLGLVHRLDRPTGGIMVFAKTSKSAKRLSDAFKLRKITKKYLVICKGIFTSKEGCLEDKIKRLDNGNSIISKDGLDAKLEYKVLEEKEDSSLVEVLLKTGRHHQIRVQFANIKHPIIGEQRYSKEKCENLCLFSYYLSFIHPTKKEKLEFIYYPKGGRWENYNIIKKYRHN